MNKRPLASLLLLVTISSSAVPQQPSPAPTPQSERPNAPAQSQQPDTQDPDDGDVVRIRTNLVQIDAVVTKDGEQVTDLTPEDFEIFEDGRKQVITNFSYVSNLPSSSPDAAVKPVTKRTGLPVVPPAIRPEDPRRTVALVVDSELHSLLYFQARDLTFTQEADGWHKAVFDLSGIIFGDNGTISNS